jgi:hypothetical protein
MHSLDAALAMWGGGELFWSAVCPSLPSLIPRILATLLAVDRLQRCGESFICRLGGERIEWRLPRQASRIRRGVAPRRSDAVDGGRVFQESPRCRPSSRNDQPVRPAVAWRLGFRMKPDMLAPGALVGNSLCGEDVSHKTD